MLSIVGFLTGYILIGLFVSGIVHRLTFPDSKWFDYPYPVLSLIFMPIAVLCLISYGIMEGAYAIGSRIHLKKPPPISWGYKLMNWLMTSKPEELIVEVGRRGIVRAKQPNKTTPVEKVRIEKPVELIEAEREVEALLETHRLDTEIRK